MTLDVVLMDQIQTSESGSYFIPEAVLILMSMDQLEQAQLATQMLIDANPNFEFAFFSEVGSTPGITVHWRKK